MESLDLARKVLQHVWAEFINHFHAAANVDLLFPKELIDFSTMDLIRNAKSQKEANQAFLYYLMSNATIESLWKLCKLLRDTAQDHKRHDSLAKSLEDELKQCKVPFSSPVAAQRGGRGEDGPSSSQATTSELSNKVFSDENHLSVVAALDLCEGTSQPIVHTDAYLAKDPPHRKVETAFFRLQSRLANIFNKHCDIADLKLFLRLRQKSDEWPFKELEVEEIDSMKDIRTIFGKICIDWLNTDAFIRLIDVLPDEKSRDDAKQHLEDYHKQLGVFSTRVLLSHIPKNESRLKHFSSCMLPKLSVTYNVIMEDFDVSKLLEQQKFLSKMFEIPEEAFHYLKSKRSSTLVTWALAISIEKAFKLFQRVTHEFWSLKEHLIIKVEIDGIFQLHLKGRNLPYQLKKALQGNRDLLVCTEHVSRQFLALVDYSHLQRIGTEPCLQPALKSVLQPSGPSNVAGSETQRQARTGDESLPAPVWMAGQQTFSGRFSSLEVTGVRLTGRRLGTGSDATVVEVEWQGTFCAAKILHEILLCDDSPGGSRRFVKGFEKECLTWSKLSHPHVAQFLGVYFSPRSTTPILLLEKMDTSLRTFLEENQKEGFLLSDKIFILHQVVQGLAYLHSRKPALVHHDLSPNNILLNREVLLAKLTDFGMSRVVDPSGGSRKSSVKGTRAFMSPEALVEPPHYDEKLDVFSFGNVIITTLTHAWPNPGAFKKYEKGEVIGLTELERRKQYVARFTKVESTVFFGMVRSCLEDHPNLRPTSLQLVDKMRQIEKDHPRNKMTAVIKKLYAQLQSKDTELQGKDTKLLASEIQLVESTTQLQKKDTQLQEKDTQLQAKETQLQEKDSQLQAKETQLQEKDTQLQEKDAKLQANETQLQESASQLQEKDSQLQKKDSQLQEKDTQLQAKETQLQEKDSQLQAKETQLQEKDTQLQEKDSKLQANETQLQESASQLQEKDSQLQKKDSKLQEKDTQLQAKETQLHEKDAELQEKDTQLQEKDAKLQANETQLQESTTQLQEKDTQLQAKETQLQESASQLQEKDSQLQKKDSQLQEKDTQLRAKETQLQESASQLQEKDSQLQEKDTQLQAKETQLLAKDSQLQAKETQLQEKDAQLQEKDIQLQEKDAKLQAKETQLQEKDAQLQVKGTQLQEKDAKLQANETQLQESTTQLQEKDTQLQANETQLQANETQLQESASQLQEKDSQLQKKDSQLQEKDTQLQAKETQLQEKDAQLQGKDTQLHEKDTQLQEKDTQIAKLLEKIQRLGLKQASPASSSSPAKSFIPGQNTVFRSDLVKPGECHSVKMSDLLKPTCSATPVNIGRDVYLAGGTTDEVMTAKIVQLYNIDSKKCRKLPPSPQYCSEAVAINGTLVLIGGRNSFTDEHTNMVSTWMAAEERWTQALPPMMLIRSRPGVLLLNNHLFAFGGKGEDRKACLDSFEVLDLNTKQWTEGRGGLPQPMYSTQLGVFGDYVMLYGGLTSDVAATSKCYTVPVQVLVDSVSNPLSPPVHWTPVQDAPYYHSSLLTTSHDAVLIGGESKADQQVTRGIYRFSSSGSWEIIGELSESRSLPTVVAVNDRSFLVLGGFADPKDVFSSLRKSVELIFY